MMPDAERLLRKLELHVLKSPEDKAYRKGVHAGIDHARWQTVAIAAVCATGLVLFMVFL